MATLVQNPLLKVVQRACLLDEEDGPNKVQSEAFDMDGRGGRWCCRSRWNCPPSG